MVCWQAMKAAGVEVPSTWGELFEDILGPAHLSAESEDGKKDAQAALERMTSTSLDMTGQTAEEKEKDETLLAEKVTLDKMVTRRELEAYWGRFVEKIEAQLQDAWTDLNQARNAC